NNYYITRDSSKANESCCFRNDNHERNLHCDLRTDKLTLYTNRNKIEKDIESFDIEELHENEDYEMTPGIFMDKYFLSEEHKNLV
ncbi:hypothetical protein COBT_004255, partial [Conglomerata obtusa]